MVYTFKSSESEIKFLFRRDISSKIRLRFPSVHSLIESGLLTEKEYQILEAMHVSYYIEHLTI